MLSRKEEVAINIRMAGMPGAKEAKAAMAMMGLLQENFRLPLVPIPHPQEPARRN